MDQSKKRRLNDKDAVSKNIGNSSVNENEDEENDEGAVAVPLKLGDEDLDSTMRFERVENMIIEAYNTYHHVLDDHSRLKLMNDIVDCFLKEGVLMKNPDICYCAERISLNFELELMEIYYTDKGGRVSGKLYHRYHNRLKYMRAKKQIAPSTRAENQILKSKGNETYIINEVEKESIDFLLRETNESVLKIVDHWRITFHYRQNLFEDTKKVGDILGQWKFLKLPLSHLLICEDFKTMYGYDKAASLRLNWNAFFDSQKFDIIKNKVKDVPTKRTVNQQPASNEYTGISIVYYLNAILFPPLRRKKLKPTIRDAQNSVIMKAINEAEITEKLSKFLKDCDEEGMEPHPIMFWMHREGEPIKFILVFQQLRYNFIRFVDCMDVCFKMFITFNVEFPFQSIQFYHLLNELFYKIEHKKQISAKVLTLTLDLK